MTTATMPDFELDLNEVPKGYVDIKEAARLIGCPPGLLHNRRWVRRHGLPAYQLLRGWPIYFDEKKLREWCEKRSRTLKPEDRRESDRHTRAKRKRRGTPTNGAS